jgi:hypothetical protein
LIKYRYPKINTGDAVVAIETQDRWSEIRKIHLDWSDAYRIMGGLVLLGIGIMIGAALFANRPDADSYATNLYTEAMSVIASVIITVFILDKRAERRESQRRIRESQERLVREVRSSDPAVARRAVHELRDRGWLEGEAGLLKGADLRFVTLPGIDLSRANLEGANLQEAFLNQANLEDANLRGASLNKATLCYAKLDDAILQETVLQDADLQGAGLWYADLQGARLVKAKLTEANLGDAILRDAKLLYADLCGANLKDADLCGADLMEANLQEARLSTTTRFDENTILPDGKSTVGKERRYFSHWTIDTDMSRFTNPDCTEFWRSDDPLSPAYRDKL